MKTTIWAVLIYAVFILVGGMIGFAQAHSVMSLVMGTSFSIALLISVYLMFKGQDLGGIIATVCSGILALFFAYRFFLTLKFMPAGLMCLLSLIVFGLLWKTYRHLFFRAQR